MGGNVSKIKEDREELRERYRPPKKVDEDDYTKPLPPMEKLPPALQKIVDNEESLWDSVRDGHASESTDSNLRYAAYANRLRTIMLSAQRYVAYTSDIGESFRPVAHPWLVRSAYAVSWSYLIGDVGYEGYKAYLRQEALLHPVQHPGVVVQRAIDVATDSKVPVNASTGGEGPIAGKVPAIEDYRAVMAQRAIFQSVASMGLPAFTIHSIVRYSGRALKNTKNVRLRSWGPIGLGLAAVPFLPYMFDKPVEQAVEWTFHRAFEYVGGPEAVGHARRTERNDKISEESKKLTEKKDL